MMHRMKEQRRKNNKKKFFLKKKKKSYENQWPNNIEKLLTLHFNEYLKNQHTIGANRRKKS